MEGSSQLCSKCVFSTKLVSFERCWDFNRRQMNYLLGSFGDGEILDRTGVPAALEPKFLIPEEYVQAFGVTISGIVWVCNRNLWLVNGCVEYHPPIITNACPPKWSQKSLRPMFIPILPRVFEVDNSVSDIPGNNPPLLWCVSQGRKTYHK